MGITTGWAAGSSLAFSFEGLLARLAIGAGASLLGAIFVRYTIAAAIAWIVLALQGGIRPLSRHDEAGFLLGGAIGLAGTTTLLFLAFARIPTSLAIVLLYVYPVLVAAGAHVLGRERLTAGVAAAGGTAVVGVALVSAPSGGAQLAGVALALAAAALNAVLVLWTEPLMARTSALGGTARMAAAAAVTTGIAAALTGQPVMPPFAALPAVAGLALVPTLAAILMLNRSLQAVGATRTAVVATLEPVFAAVWGVMLLHEHLQPVQWLGAALTVAGATAVSLLPKPPQLAGSPPAAGE